MFTDIQSSIETVDVRTHYNAFKGDLMFTFYNTNKKYISVTSTFNVNLNDSRHLNVVSNINDLQYSIANQEIAILEPGNYIKGLRVGETELTITGEGIEKTVTIIVSEEQVVPVTPVNPTFDGLPLNMTLNVNEVYTYSISGQINTSDVIMDYDSSIISVNIENNTLTIGGISEGNANLTISYNGNTTNSSIRVVDNSGPDEPEEQIYYYITNLQLPNSLDMYVGETKQIVPIITPPTAIEPIV
ncbi:MAG: hypothetical protein J6T10_12315 [Methanobrevibacter sp.]|nr:hypothetical protein [Methanobrevibacter sp.]